MAWYRIIDCMMPLFLVLLTCSLEFEQGIDHSMLRPSSLMRAHGWEVDGWLTENLFPGGNLRCDLASAAWCRKTYIILNSMLITMTRKIMKNTQPMLPLVNAVY